MNGDNISAAFDYLGLKSRDLNAVADATIFGEIPFSLESQEIILRET